MTEEIGFVMGMEGSDDAYASESEFMEQLQQQQKLLLSFQKYVNGWVFWRQLDGHGRETMNDKIKLFLKENVSLYPTMCVVQYWRALEDEQQRVYLTTSDQPFAVGRKLYKGVCWYRQRCEAHRYRVDEGAGEDELGPVGRVYRKKQPESSPDLRLYSTKEFPLRDSAALSGLRGYYALPLFDLHTHHFYGVIEAYFRFNEGMLHRVEQGLKNAELRTTHLKYLDGDDVHIEIENMIELAAMVMPQLQLAHVWRPCLECSNTSNNLSSLESTFFRSYYKNIWNADEVNYFEACELHHLQIAEDTNPIARTVMSSDHKPCICRNICDLSISDNPLAHYAQKARLSFCFAIRVQSLYNSRDFYLLQFFLQFNSGDNALVGSLLQKVLSIMQRELKSFDFPYKRHIGEELIVEVVKENMVGYETFRYKHDDLENVNMLMVMEGFEYEYSVSEFMKYLQEPDLCYYEKYQWIFWSSANSNLSPVSVDTIQEKIKCLIREITCSWEFTFYYTIAQFWAAKKDDMNRCYLETAGQPFAVSSLSKGLASFRKQCVEHKYYVDDAAKGPPGRVFLNGHPEYNHDLRLYTTTEFALRNHTPHSSVRHYYVLPIFERKQQHVCVGVLELLLPHYGIVEKILKEIGDALKSANLMTSTCNPSDMPGNEGLTEMKEACKLFEEIPQVYAIVVWVSNNKCTATINTKLCCMKRLSCSIDTVLPMFKQVESGKGMSGMALASQNNSCLCLNLSAFGLADQFHAQAVESDVCFAICLQSRHTGHLVYLLEFYLNHAPCTYDYFSSFLCLLLPLMKLKLASFKVASGQQLGDKLVVEVIQFSQVNEFDVLESDHSDGVPFIFKFVNYKGHIHCQENKHDLDDGVGIVVETQECIDNLKKKEAEVGKKSGTGLNVTLSDLLSLCGHKRKDAAEALGVSEPTFKRSCRKLGIKRWPHISKYKKNPSLFMADIANQSGLDSQPNIDELPNSTNIPPPDMPPTHPKSPKVNMVLFYANYESKTVKFKLCHTAGVEKLVNEVAIRLKLEVGNFEMEYLDEINKKILLTCDADLELCLESLAADQGKNYIEIFVTKKAAETGKPYMQVVPPSSTSSSSTGGYIHHFPSCFHNYIVSTKDVVADGHCGFRAIADLLGYGEDSWDRVRRDLIDELKQNQQLYTSVFIEHGAVDKTLERLRCFGEKASNAHWFTLPEMGHLVASAYNVALVTLSTHMCYTFLPLRTAPSNLRCICIGLVNNNHFVQVFLRDGHPLPPILDKWREYHYHDAAAWRKFYAPQLELYHTMSGICNNVILDTISLDGWL